MGGPDWPSQSSDCESSEETLSQTQTQMGRCLKHMASSFSSRSRLICAVSSSEEICWYRSDMLLWPNKSKEDTRSFIRSALGLRKSRLEAESKSIFTSQASAGGSWLRERAIKRQWKHLKCVLWLLKLFGCAVKAVSFPKCDFFNKLICWIYWAWMASCENSILNAGI